MVLSKVTIQSHQALKRCATMILIHPGTRGGSTAPDSAAAWGAAGGAADHGYPGPAEEEQVGGALASSQLCSAY